MFEHLINNKLNFDFNTNYVVIIGESVSTTARSPFIWNKVLSNFNLPIKMLPLDISSENLFPLFEILKKDTYCLGGSVAAPYKTMISKFLGDNKDEISLKSNSVNLLFRKNNELIGSNSDGLAAYRIVRNDLLVDEKSNILIIGSGGVAKSISVALTSNNYNVDIYSRSKILIDGIDNNYIIDEDIINYSKYDLIINATSLGSYPSLQNKSPLSQNDFKNINKSTKIFDVIYNPKETLFLRYAKENNLDYINGLKMNKIQALISISTCFNKLDLKKVELIINSL